MMAQALAAVLVGIVAGMALQAGVPEMIVVGVVFGCGMATGEYLG